jgi:hypothetical protein
MARHPQVVGVLLLVAMHALLAFGPFALGLPAMWAGLKPEAAPLLIGVVQLFYVIPATLLALKLGHPAVALGIVKGAGVTFLLNLGACALFISQLSRIM